MSITKSAPMKNEMPHIMLQNGGGYLTSSRLGGYRGER